MMGLIPSWFETRKAALLTIRQPSQACRGTQLSTSRSGIQNGALLAEGDSVTLIKDLKLKGSSTVLKRGTVIKNIHLTGDAIEGRSDNVKGLVPRTEFLKKA
jgi:protein PhnA